MADKAGKRVHGVTGPDPLSDEGEASMIESQPSQGRAFDPTEKDCFARFINLTDVQVGMLLDQMRELIDANGEYDQGDEMHVSWDEAKDLLTVAELLWADRNFLVGQEAR